METFVTGKESKHSPDEVEPEFKSAIGNENILIFGYIRRHLMNVISEICKICIAFYGPHSTELINFMPLAISDLPIFNHHSFEVHPFAQYVDGNFMIAYAFKKGFRHIAWSGFVRIDLKTNIVQKLQCFVNGQPFQYEPSWRRILFNLDNASEEVQELDYSKGLQLMVSDQVTEDWTEYSQFAREEAKKNEKLRPWNAFNDNLWKMFVSDSLYFPNADDEWLEHQPIWSVIQLLSVMYFNNKQKEEMIVPEVQFNYKWNFSDNDDYDDDDDDDDDSCGYSVYRYETNKEENADKMNAKTGIIEYRRGIRMKAVCYLSVNWGGDYWSLGGCDHNLYLTTFEIEKGKNSEAPMMQIAFETAKSHCYGGIAMS